MSDNRTGGQEHCEGGESLGYIKLWRKSIDSAVFQDPELWKLWCLCLMKASHKEIWESADTVKEPVKILPGQFITGRFALHRDYYTKKVRNMKSDKTIWNWMQILEKLGNLTINSSKKYSIITIVNWHTYQLNVVNNFQQNFPVTSNRLPTDFQQTSTYKNEKNEKNENNNPPIAPPLGGGECDVFTKEFIAFWQAYPRKVGKAAAWKAWKRPNGTRPKLDTIIRAIERQKRSSQWQENGGRFIPHPATWLNQGRWDDEIVQQGGGYSLPFTPTEPIC